VRVEGLEQRYGSRVAVDDVTFAVEPATVFALLGPNGAGKTTTIETIEGYRAPSGGRVRVLGLDPRRDRGRLAARVGIMLQGGTLYPQATPVELLALFGGFFRDPVPPSTLIEALGLGAVAGTRYRSLSGGERQRLALGLALAGRPELLILDEPSAGMDPAAKAAVRSLIASLRREGRTILLTTHELADVERLADHVAILHHGRIVAQGTVADLTGGSEPAARIRLAEPLEEADLGRLAAALSSPGQRVTVHADRVAGSYRLAGAPMTPVLLRHLAEWCSIHGVGIEEWRVGRGSLEDRYLELTGDVTALGETGDETAREARARAGGGVPS